MLTRNPSRIALNVVATLTLAAIVPGGGCGSGGHPEGASPVVRPDSETGKKAIEETENLLKLRAEQESKARKRHKTLPSDG